MLVVRSQTTRAAASTARWGTVLAALMLVLVAIPVRAAEPDLYKSELSGWTIAVYGQNYVIDSIALEEYPHGKGERIYISSKESLGFGEISFFDDADTAEQSLDVMMTDFEAASEEFELLDSGNNGSIWYGLAHVVVAGKPGYFYVEIAQDIDGDIDLLQSFYTLDADFLQQLALIRADVTLDNNTFLGVTALDLELTITADTADRDLAASTPVVSQVQFASMDATLTVQPPLVLANHVQNDTLEGVYVQTASGDGTGIVAYLQDDVDTAHDVSTLIISDVPIGEIPPESVYSDPIDDDHDVSAYRVQGEQGEVVMIVSVTRVAEGMWRIESWAAPQEVLSQHIATAQSSLKIDGEPVFADLNIDDILAALASE